MHEIMGPEPSSEGNTAKLAKERLAVDNGSGCAPVGFSYLGHIGHHIVRTGAHNGDPLVAVLQLHVRRPLDHKCFASCVH